MKRFLLSLVALVITSVCFAQDIIVKKDGSTIKSKVLKVTQSEVEYKKFDNQSGPTYTIATKDLQCINYENGSKDSFVSENYNPSIVTNETATQYSDDSKLLKMYGDTDLFNKGKKIQKIGYFVGGGLVVFGATIFTLVMCDEIIDDDYTAWGPILAGAGVATGVTCYFVGQNIKNKSMYSVQSTHLYQHEFNVGNNSNLMVGVDMLKDNTFKNQTLGLGLSYNF